jgi:N12 class adenine-specific DNA methylase
MQTRFSEFVNVPELSVMVRQVMDVVTSAQLEQYVVRPKVKRELILVPQTPGQSAYQAQLARAWRRSSSGPASRRRATTSS